MTVFNDVGVDAYTKIYNLACIFEEMYHIYMCEMHVCQFRVWDACQFCIDRKYHSKVN